MATTRLLPSSAHHHGNQNHTNNNHQQFYQDKVFIAMENVDANFDLKGLISGPNNSYISHIQLTGARCWLRGKGSGYLETESGREACEALHIHIQHPSPSGLSQAKLLAENLVQTVHQQYYHWRESRWQQPPPVVPMINHSVPNLPHVPPPVSMPVSSCGNIFAVPPPCQIVLPTSLPPTTTQLIITDHNSVTGAPTQQQVVIFKQELPTSVSPPLGRYSLSSSPPLLQETITTTTTTTYYFPGDTGAPIPPPPIPPVSYPLAMLPPVVLPVPPPPANFVRMNRCWDYPPRLLPISDSPVLYNPPPSGPPPVRPPGAASTLVAWSADFPHQQRLNTQSSMSQQFVETASKKSETSTSTAVVFKRPQNESTELSSPCSFPSPSQLLIDKKSVNDNNQAVSRKRLKSRDGPTMLKSKSFVNSNNLAKPEAVVVKKTSALSSLAVAYNSNDE